MDELPFKIVNMLGPRELCACREFVDVQGGGMGSLLDAVRVVLSGNATTARASSGLLHLIGRRKSSITI
jgi:hypothetical protein